VFFAHLKSLVGTIAQPYVLFASKYVIYELYTLFAFANSTFSIVPLSTLNVQNFADRNYQ